jgi:tetratricopeptide (TPR) repeat protein
LSRIGRHAEALATFERMLEHPDSNPMVQNNVAMELACIGQYGEALEACAAALAAEQGLHAIWDTAGFIRLKRREYAEAETALLKSIEMNPHYAWAWRHLLHVYHDWGQAEKLAKAEARVGYYLPEMLELFHREKGTDIRQ